MGWTGIMMNKPESLREILAYFDRELGPRYDIKDSFWDMYDKDDKHSMGVLYFLTKNIETETVFVSVIPMTYRNGEFIYKWMDNSVGPCYYYCPKEWIKRLTEPTSQYDIDWRRRIDPSYCYNKEQLKLEL